LSASFSDSVSLRGVPCGISGVVVMAPIPDREAKEGILYAWCWTRGRVRRNTAEWRRMVDRRGSRGSGAHPQRRFRQIIVTDKGSILRQELVTVL